MPGIIIDVSRYMKAVSRPRNRNLANTYPARTEVVAVMRMYHTMRTRVFAIHRQTSNLTMTEGKKSAR